MRWWNAAAVVTILALLAVLVPRQMSRWERAAWNLATDGCWYPTNTTRTPADGAPAYRAPDDAPLSATLVVLHSPRVAVVHADQRGDTDTVIHTTRIGRHVLPILGTGQLCVATGEPIQGATTLWQRFAAWDSAADSDRARALASLDAKRP